MKKKIRIIILVISIIFVIGYSIFKPMQTTINKYQGDYIIYYKGSLYEKIFNWYPIGKINKKDKAWFGYSSDLTEKDKIKGNRKIVLYENDSQTLFFREEKGLLSDEHYFHKKEDELPKPYYKNSKIILEIDEKKEIVLPNEISIEFKDFVEMCLGSSGNIKRVAEMQKGIATIKVVYNNYPAWQYFAWLGFYEKNVIMLPITSSDKYIYFVLPENLANQIKELL